MCQDKKIKLRVPEMKDAPLLLSWENNPDYWRVSNTDAPYSLIEIQNFIESASQVRKNKQLRFVIDDETDKSIGLIDLYDIDFKHRRGGIGILITDEKNRGKGYAKQAIMRLIDFAKTKLAVLNFYAKIHEDNLSSQHLFESLKFKKTGEMKNWYLENDTFITEYFYQFLSNEI